MSGSLHCVLYGGWLVVLVTGGLANSSLSDESTEAHPVVVELFESQGCSSCPPAEAVLEFLAREFNQSIIPLSFHVDYWDQLGWKDPFSDPRFTERQGSYANAFHQDSMYTPEMVVQGDVGFNGADEKRARQEITSHQSAPGSRFSLHVTRSVARRIKFEAQWPAGLPQQPQAMTAVLYETAEPVHVLRGENAGATMSGAFAVRTLAPLERDSARLWSATLILANAWKSNHMRAVVLVLGVPPHILAAQEAPIIQE